MPAAAGTAKDAAPDDGDGGPLRRCIVSGAERPKEELIRFVVSPSGEVVPDIDERLPGRGFWLSPDRDVIHTALARKAFARAARGKADVPGDLADRLEALLTRRCLDCLGLARRAGQAIAGADKVEERLRSGKKAGALVVAREASRDGRAKILALAPKAPLVALFGEAELGAVFGRERTVYAVLASGKLARSLVLTAAKLAGLQSAPGGERNGRQDGGR